MNRHTFTDAQVERSIQGAQKATQAPQPHYWLAESGTLLDGKYPIANSEGYPNGHLLREMVKRANAYPELLAACDSAADAIQIAFGASDSEMRTLRSETLGDGLLSEAWKALKAVLAKCSPLTCPRCATPTSAFGLCPECAKAPEGMTHTRTEMLDGKPVRCFIETKGGAK